MKFKVTITLKSGVVRTHKVKATPENMDRVLEMIDTCWKSNNKNDGFVNFDSNYYRTSEIAHYSLRKMWF